MPIPGTSIQMGRDWFVQDVAGTRVFFHGGDTLGQHADVIGIPEQRFVLVVLTNGQGGGAPRRWRRWMPPWPRSPRWRLWRGRLVSDRR